LIFIGFCVNVLKASFDAPSPREVRLMVFALLVAAMVVLILDGLAYVILGIFFVRLTSKRWVRRSLYGGVILAIVLALLAWVLMRLA
jgi:hypothetical protein